MRMPPRTGQGACGRGRSCSPSSNRRKPLSMRSASGEMSTVAGCSSSRGDRAAQRTSRLTSRPWRPTITRSSTKSGADMSSGTSRPIAPATDAGDRLMFGRSRAASRFAAVAATTRRHSNRGAAMTANHFEELVSAGSDASGAPVSLDDVLLRGIEFHWDEAVAIVQELCAVSIAASGDAALVPDLKDVRIGSDGTVTLWSGRGEKNPSAAGRTLHLLMVNAVRPGAAPVVRHPVDHAERLSNPARVRQRALLFLQAGRHAVDSRRLSPIPPVTGEHVGAAAASIPVAGNRTQGESGEACDASAPRARALWPVCRSAWRVLVCGPGRTHVHVPRSK